MRVNAAKGITSNQPLIAGCRPLMLGRQEAAFNLVWLDHSSRGSRYSSSQHTGHPYRDPRWRAAIRKSPDGLRGSADNGAYGGSCRDPERFALASDCDQARKRMASASAFIAPSW